MGEAMTARAREAREGATVKPSTDDRLDAIEALRLMLEER